MQTLFYDGTTAEIRERDVPEPREGEALVRILKAGVCNTDLEIARGYMGFRGVLGHEFVGEVVSGPESWEGQRVVGEINFACGQCEACRRDLGRHCPTRRVMGILEADGAFAEYAAVPVANLHAVDDAIPDDAAVFVEPLAAAFEILEQLPIERGSRCVVLGDGKLGLLVSQVLDLAGGRVLAVGRHRDKLDILADRGIETRTISDWEPQADADLVVEATGRADGLTLALAATRPRGTVVMKSTIADPHAVDWAPVVIHEIRVQGSRCGPFAPALAALAAGEVEVQRLISDRMPLGRADEALRRAGEPGVLKVLVGVSASR